MGGSGPKGLTVTGETSASKISDLECRARGFMLRT